MTGTRGNVLKIRCSDGRSRKPDHIRCDWVHEIRMPGGLLFPDLCAHSVYGREQTFALSTPIDLAIQSQINELRSLITPETGRVIGELVILLAIATMVDLKKPERIILVTTTTAGPLTRSASTSGQSSPSLYIGEKS
jgi:hypothetical protein